MKKHVDSDTPFLVHEEGIDLNLCQFAGARPNSLSEIGDLGGKTADVDRFRTPISVKQMRQFQTAQPGLDLARSHGQKQGHAIADKFGQHAPRSQRQGQAELRIGADRKDQFGDGFRSHLLHEEAIGQRGGVAS